jgi:DNA-binding MarR family transcriptional regulator
MTETVDRPLVELPFPSADDPRLRAWVAFLRAHAAVTRRLEAELHAERDLGLAEYDALVQLALADNRRLRMSELAERVVLSRSGVSRLVDRLEAMGLVARAACADDARVSWATLTDAGIARLRDASPIHLRGVETHFLAQIPDDDREALVRALEMVVRGLRSRGPAAAAYATPDA